MVYIWFISLYIQLFFHLVHGIAELYEVGLKIVSTVCHRPFSGSSIYEGINLYKSVVTASKTSKRYKKNPKRLTRWHDLGWDETFPVAQVVLFSGTSTENQQMH